MALKPRNDKPNPAARGQLITQLIAYGYKGQDLANIIRSGRTRAEIAIDLISLQKVAPKESGKK